VEKIPKAIGAPHHQDLLFFLCSICGNFLFGQGQFLGQLFFFLQQFFFVVPMKKNPQITPKFEEPIRP
jgi:hypothetical protein